MMFTINSIESLSSINLLNRVTEVFQNAFKTGDIIFQYETSENVEMYQINSIQYEFKIINNLSKRPINRKSVNENENKKLNPFLKNEPELTVCDSLLDKYKLLLNKFPNTENHFLMVTKQFVKQDTLLNSIDLITILAMLRNLNTEGKQQFFSFFNSGNQSGYSQIHKHIQFLPFPTYNGENFKPFMDEFIKDYEYEPQMKPLTCPNVLFKHFVIPLPNDVTEDIIFNIYKSLLNNLLNLFKWKNLLDQDELLINDELNPKISYNLIITERYLLIIPRSNAKFEDCWANSLQFIGLFSGRNEEIKQKVLQIGFQELLAKVGFQNDDIDYSDNNMKL